MKIKVLQLIILSFLLTYLINCVPTTQIDRAVACLQTLSPPKIEYTFYLDVDQDVELNIRRDQIVIDNFTSIPMDYNDGELPSSSIEQVKTEKIENNRWQIMIGIRHYYFIHPEKYSGPFTFDLEISSADCEKIAINDCYAGVEGEDYYPWGPPDCGVQNDWFGTNSTPISITCTSGTN